MSRLVGLTLVTAVLLLSTSTVCAQFEKYKRIEAYEIRPGFLVLPRYSSDGKVCEIGLEKLHYSPEMIRLDSSLSRKEINDIFDELVPADAKGPRSKDIGGNLMIQSGNGFGTSMDFENVLIQIYGSVLPTKDEKGITVDEVAATLKWKNRKCR